MTVDSFRLLTFFPPFSSFSLYYKILIFAINLYFCFCFLLHSAGFDFYRKGFGKYKTSFKAIECPTVPGKDGNIQLRFSGNDNWYIKLQARNSKLVQWTNSSPFLKRIIS